LSEYQYYEFRTVDRALTPAEMDALRQISSRAEITPYSLTNEYHFGSFKGKPLELMKKYFDAFLYYANWGTHQLMFRIAKSALPVETVTAYQSECFQVHAAGDNIILELRSPPEVEPDWDQVGDENWMAAFLPLRQESEEEEPPLPAGLRKLSPALRQLAEFLYLDHHLLAAASTDSAEPAESPSAESMAAWVAKLPATEKDRILLRLLQGEGARAGNELLRRFRADSVSPPARNGETRTSGELVRRAREQAEAEERRRSQKAAREAERKAREEAAARAQYLDQLAARQEDAWTEVERAISFKQAREYEKAVQLLLDLREVARRAGTEAAFSRRLQALRQVNTRKVAFIERLDRAGLS
jgi:hypothetical protein